MRKAALKNKPTGASWGGVDERFYLARLVPSGPAWT
jgi:hypothetical protein